MCAAPNSAYLTEKLPLQDVGVVKYDNLLALKLVEYGSNIKTLFYLDALLVAKENVGSKEGFCGLVIVGGANAAMHASARWSKGRTSPDNGATKYIILNDGGLNTFADSMFSSSAQEFSIGVIISYNFYSSYYASTTSYGYRIRKSGDTSWASVSSGDIIPAKSSKIYSVSFTQFEVGDVLEVQPFAVNEEGYIYFNIINYTVTRFALNLSGPALWPSQATGSKGIYYSDKSDFSGKIYTTLNGPQAATSGYYQTDFNSWIEVDAAGQVVNGGGIGVWPPGDPATPIRFIPISFLGVADFDGNKSWEWACENTSQLTPLYCYFDNNTNKYCYTNSNNGTDLLAKGYYYVSETQFMYINNGSKIQDGNCTDGPIIPEI